MIRINLLGDEAQKDSSAILWLGGMIISFIGYGIVCTFLYLDINSQVTIREGEIEDLERQLAQLQEKTKEVNGLEAKRAELSQKLAIIAELKLSKFGPVRVLDDLNISVPDHAWITDVRERGSAIMISGLALDGQTVANFMQKLEDSNYFGGIRVETKQATYDGVKMQSFVLNSQLSYAGLLKVEKKAAVEEKEAA
ncbi:MAG: PilN domain-containing protein [Bdellovibrionales bacterium]|nr:PilN domain-containing protein [Bdellovibrionales bacterium]